MIVDTEVQTCDRCRLATWKIVMEVQDDKYEMDLVKIDAEDMVRECGNLQTVLTKKRMTKFNKFKADMGDEYDKKVKELAKSQELHRASKVCRSCNQLEFDHRAGSCTRLGKSATTKYTPEEIDEISNEIMKDVLEAIIKEEKTKLLVGNQQVEASKFLVGGEAGNLADAFNRLADELKNQKQAPTQVTKVKIPPTWAKESFADYKAEVEAWEVAHPSF